MNWTENLPTDEGWYWNRKNKYKKENIYYVWISLEESVLKDVNVLYCRRSGQSLFDKERVESIGGEWYGPIKPPE
jgi:hypothetical protein